MKTIEIKLFEYSELPTEKAKEKARDWFNKDGANVDYIYSDAHETVKAFFKHFPGSEGRNSWLDINTNNIDDNILELSGTRLATYIYNNFGDVLFKGKYFKSWSSKNKVIHKKVKSTIKSKETGWRSMGILSIVWKKEQWGEYWNEYRGLQKTDTCCNLTGVRYDDDLLGPIYDFLKAPDNTNFEDLLNNCFEALRKSVDDEVESEIAAKQLRKILKQTNIHF